MKCNVRNNFDLINKGVNGICDLIEKEKSSDKKAILNLLILLNAIYGLDKDCFIDYQNNETVYMSAFGGVEEIDEDTKAKIKWLEDKYNVKVYHVMYDSVFTTFMFYDPDKDYETQKEQIIYGVPRTYVHNRIREEFSEFGAVSIAGFFKSIYRNDIM